MIRRRAMIGIDRELPSGYARCKYLEGSGHQYIDTGLKLTSNDTVKLSIIFTELSTKFMRIFGARTTYTSNAFWLCAVPNRGNSFRFDIGNKVVFLANAGAEPYVRFDFTMSTEEIIINGVRTLCNGGSFSNIYNAYLFTSNESNPQYILSEITKIKVFSYSVKERQELVPAVRYTDGKPGYYDIISGMFLVNQGTGEFGYELMDGTYVAPV